MKRNLYYLVFSFLIIGLGACTKEGLWNTEGSLAADKYSQIVGQLINDDDNTPLKGVKILFERQTDAAGANTFVDTVSTDTEGKFSYKVPFPNKVRLVVRDTGRYMADTSSVHAVAYQDYNVTMNSHPRYGVTSIKVNVNDEEFKAPFKGVNVSLWVRESNTESYSKVETLAANDEGNVQFSNIAWPVNYKVRVEENDRLYKLDSLSGKITNRTALDLKLNSKKLFGKTDLSVLVADKNNKGFAKVNVAIWTKVSAQADYVALDTLLTDNAGRVTFKQIDYPIYYKIVLAEGALSYTYDAIEKELLDKNPAEEKIVATKNFDQADIQLQVWDFYQNKVFANKRLNISYKTVVDKDFSPVQTVVFDANGKLSLANFIYPAEIKVTPVNIGDFKEFTLNVDAKVVANDIRFNLFDVTPKFANTRFSSSAADNKAEVFLKGKVINSMKVDSKGDMIAIIDNKIVRIKPDGTTTDISNYTFTNAWGVAIQDDNTFYVIENTSAHTIRKVVVNPTTEESTVTLFAGAFNTSGTTDGALTTARFNRPSDAVYDKTRNCLYISEWQNSRIRKIDLTTNVVSTLISGTSVGYAYGIALSNDNRYLYLASHTTNAGVKRLDLTDNTIVTLSTNGSTRYVTVTSSGQVIYTVFGAATASMGDVRLITSELTDNNSVHVRIAGNGVSNPTGLESTYSGTANVSMFGAGDGSVGMVVYNPWTGKLYIGSTINKNVYAIYPNR